MTFRYRRTYTGKVQACILDWAGTTMDFGCLAPAFAFVEVFKRQGVPITVEEARAPMGAHKRVHIHQITEMDPVRQRWQEKHGRLPDDSDVETMYGEFIPLQLDCLSAYSDLIPGTLEAVEAMRGRGIKIGTTTGYTTEMTAINAADAERQGYVPDSTVCANELPLGRPYPHMCLQNLINLGVDCVQACVKVDDTITGIEEGLNAGMWSIALAVSGNEVGLSLTDWQALSGDEQKRLRGRAYDRLRPSGAHYVIDSIADLMPCIDDIDARLAHGETP
jgi:phosphonoacetaldehyde hydrolase